MARQTVGKALRSATARVTRELRERLEDLLYSRYPKKEWATFFVFGLRETPEGAVLSFVDLLAPGSGDLNPNIGIVEFHEPYSLRAALFLRSSDLFIGVIHSHPQGVAPLPSTLDDDMDDYYREYFSGFSKSSAYFSLIFAKDKGGRFQFSGRGWIGDQAYTVQHLVTLGRTHVTRDSIRPKCIADPEYRERLQRIYGKAAAVRLLNSSIVIVGCSGTGSPAAETLARAGVGRFILIDPQRLDKSNLERVHGSYPDQFKRQPYPYKVQSLRDLILRINPHAEVIPVVGNILQQRVRDYAVTADLLLCCTDSNHSRAASAELAYRYLLPAIDIGVQLDGEKGQVNHEVGQHTVYAPGLPCAYCRDAIDPWVIQVELMSEQEKARRRREAEAAKARGADARGYWRDVPALPTVGHFTALAGNLAASYAIGWLTGTFFPPRNFFQFDILGDGFGFVGFDLDPRENCVCQRLIRNSDQAAAYSVASAPDHWPDPIFL
jgi:molybdopterin/thiamine biosynthesis adenylyltransferase